MVMRQDTAPTDQFMEFIQRPENRDRNFELIGGEIVEMVSNGLSSEIGAFMVAFIGSFVYRQGMGRVTGADGGYQIHGEKYIPDAAFISKAKQPTSFRGAYNPTPPDLVVEVLSPANHPKDMRVKIANYLSAGVVVWVLDPDEVQIEVYVPGKPPKILKVGDVLDGGDVLPGFNLDVKSIFALGEDEG